MVAFSRTYENYDALRYLQPAYEARRAELDAAGQYPYNSSFMGHLGETFDTERDEEYAVYMLQCLHDLDELAVKVEAFKAAGGVEITHLDATTRFARVARFGWYVGGRGWAEWSDVRLAARTGQAGPPSVAIPKGKRTHGFDVSSGTVLGIPA